MSDETAMTPITPDEGASAPPKVTPAAMAATSSAATVKLKPVIRKPLIRKPVIGASKPVTLKPAAGTPPAPAAVPEAAAEAAAAPVEPAASAAPEQTPQLKSITSPIAAQATLRKTGIIADQDLTEAQKQASKSRTARISLSDAIGAAPVKNEAAPMKTIRIKRPVDLEAAPAAAPAAAAEPSVTQRKTLKIARPGGVSRPGVKIGKKPAAPVPAPAAEAAAEGDVPEIADLPEVPETAAAAPAPANGVPYSKVAMGLSVAVQIAACVAMGVLAYWLFEATELIFAF
jgi:hypothetical protein